MADKLDEGRLIRRLRAPAGPWHTVRVQESTGSTNDDALAAAEPYLIVIAAEQTAGRGRRARAWSSPPGTSIAMSMVLPMTPHPGAAGSGEPGWVPLATGLGVRDALAGLLAVAGCPGVQVVLKWPNDVLITGAPLTSAPAGSPPGAPAKVSGILCQHASGEPLVVAGAGVNVTVPLTALPAPEGTALAATSLHLCTGDPGAITREDVAEAIAAQVAARHAAWRAGGEALRRLKADYRVACVTPGALIDVHLPGDRVRRARATGITDGGQLAIVDENGTDDEILAGDVVHIRAREGA